MNLYWNYFLSIESDLDNLSRYIEFSTNNYDTYSVELVRIYLSAASEIDVLFKLICKQLDPAFDGDRINDYWQACSLIRPQLIIEKAFINRYTLSFTPFAEWANKQSYKGNNPTWWCMYNKVKHSRNEFYKEACLKNVLNCAAGLLILNYYYTKLITKLPMPEDVTRLLIPAPNMFSLNSEYYYKIFIS